ncbi:class II aldolase/adducin family protein [Phenylobacterium sp. LjRoot219]|uniref:class II aldolase/adducin family protein n=1 Tax=Phenylobacterium sp. LjRoot219 TaxID=3342283 RepID=UPI003ECF6941
MADLPAELVAYIDEVKNDAIHAYNFLEETDTLSASRTFGVAHRAPEHDALISVRFPQPWVKNREPKVTISRFSEQPDHILNEARLEADTLVHVHTPYLSAWSLAHKPFPILYVAAQRHLLAREIPNHLERTRSVLEVVRERLDKHPELAPPPALLESNGGVNFWGKGVLRTAQLILFVEEAARFQAIAEQIGGAQVYTPGALDLQWKRTGLLEKSRAYVG